MTPTRTARRTQFATNSPLIEPAGPVIQPFEAPSILDRVLTLILNPSKNFLLPASFLRWAVSLSRSPLIAETLVNPGGWRSMEIVYRNADPVDWLDLLAQRKNPICMAARNRRRIITAKLSKWIAERGRDGLVTIVGVGAGPGVHVQSAIANSGIDSSRVNAWLIDLADDAFPTGKALANRLGLSDSIHFLRGDARRIRESLADIRADIFKIVGLAEYLTDDELLQMLRALGDVAAPEAQLVTHGIVDPYGTSRFFRRVFGLRHRYRNADEMSSLLLASGFRPIEVVTDATGIHPIISAVRDA